MSENAQNWRHMHKPKCFLWTVAFYLLWAWFWCSSVLMRTNFLGSATESYSVIAESEPIKLMDCSLSWYPSTIPSHDDVAYLSKLLRTTITILHMHCRVTVHAWVMFIAFWNLLTHCLEKFNLKFNFLKNLGFHERDICWPLSLSFYFLIFFFVTSFLVYVAGVTEFLKTLISSVALLPLFVK